MNGVKDDLCDALIGFCPDLPTQFSSQVESLVEHMRENIGMIFDGDDFQSFMDIYKINVDAINAMMDPGQKESGDFRTEDQENEEKENFDEHMNIRVKMQNYESNITKLYDKIKERGIDYISLNGLKMRVSMLKGNSAQRVEWMKQHMKEKEE
ncbi:hypothetical protein KBC03_07350 [Patescibacteria group bacterium]|nr:hypothetical protein [Patescibacteria group bacterium]